MAEDLAQAMGAVHRSLKHDSAELHVSGAARYIDDSPEATGLLHIAFGQSAKAHARILSMDLEPVRRAPGVALVLTAADIPGENNVGPVRHDDRLFADGRVECVGQSLFAVAATSIEAARRAAKLAQVVYEALPAAITIDQAREMDLKIEDDQIMARGDAAAALAASPRRLQGELEIGGQDHFYLEGQISLATPGEDGRVHIACSTQHPSEVQHLVAHVLGVSQALVTVEVRRMGGGFGGKETQAALGAAAAALVVAAVMPADTTEATLAEMFSTGVLTAAFFASAKASAMRSATRAPATGVAADTICWRVASHLRAGFFQPRSWLMQAALMAACLAPAAWALAARTQAATQASTSVCRRSSASSGPMCHPVTPSATVSTRPPVEATMGTVP